MKRWRSWRPLCFWFYPLSKAIAFWEHTEWKLRCHCLVVGPYGLALLWRVKKS